MLYLVESFEYKNLKLCILMLAILSFDLELVYKICEFLNEEWSGTTTKEERRLCTSPRFKFFVKTR